MKPRGFKVGFTGCGYLANINTCLKRKHGADMVFRPQLLGA